MSDYAKDVSQEQANELCRAATAVYFAILYRESMEQKEPITLPLLMCPVTPPPCLCSLDEDLAQDATAFLIRLGIVHIDELGRPRRT